MSPTSSTPSNLVLRPRKLHFIMLLLGSLVFVAVGVLMMQSGEAFYGFITLSFFGLGIPVFLVGLMPGSSYLKLTSEGFEVCNMYKKYFIKWSEVEFFMPMEEYEMCVYNFSSTHQQNTTLGNLSANMTGVDAGLPDTYGKSTEELAKIMNSWKQRYAPSQPTHQPNFS